MCFFCAITLCKQISAELVNKQKSWIKFGLDSLKGKFVERICKNLPIPDAYSIKKCQF